MRACRTCLAVNAPLCLLGISEGRGFLNKILNDNGYQGLHPRCYVCLTCKTLLNKTSIFIKRVLTAQKTLLEVIQRENKVSASDLYTIDRSGLNLDTNLISKNLFNFDILEDENSKTFVDGEYTIQNAEVKSENIYENELQIDVHEDIDNVVDDAKDTINNVEIKCELPDRHNASNTNPDEACMEGPENTENPDEDNSDEDITNSEDLIKDNIAELDNILCSMKKLEEDKDTSFVKHNDTTLRKAKSTKIYDVTKNDSIIDKTIKKKSKQRKFSTKSVKVKTKRRPKKRELEYKELSEYETDPEHDRQCKEIEERDGDFNPRMCESESDEDSDSSILYNDNGKRMKKPDDRVYPMNCAECEYEIHSKVEHHHHYQTSHKDKEYPYQNKRQFVCKFCGSAYRQQVHLKYHLLTHGKKKIVCNTCGSRFHNAKRLYAHKLRHLRRFMCDYCKKSFGGKPDLQRHIRIHTGEKPYLCHICGAGFAHSGNVGVHIRSKHQHSISKKKLEKLASNAIKDSKKPIKTSKRNPKKKLKKEKDVEKSDPEDSDEEDIPLNLLKK